MRKGIFVIGMFLLMATAMSSCLPPPPGFGGGYGYGHHHHGGGYGHHGYYR